MAAQQPRAATRAARRKTNPVTGIVVLAVLVIGIAVYVSSHRSEAKRTNAAKAYCQTVQDGHTTMLNTTLALGQPDSTVTHDGYRYLGYGSVTFGYVWTGEQDSSVLSDQTGC